MHLAFRILTELTIIAHFAFILFVIAGGFIARRSRWLTLVHLSALGWAIYAELASGVVCPLTTLENYFAQQAGLSSYQEDFITHYLVPVIYPESLTPALQRLCVAVVVVTTVIAYATRKKQASGQRPQ